MKWSVSSAPRPILPHDAIRAAAWTLLVFAASQMICGCHKQEKRLHIAVIEPTGGLQYWEGFNHRLSSTHPGIDYRYAAPESLNDFPSQARMVSQAIDDHVDGILLSPTHQLVLVFVVKKALEAGIPVVIVGAPLDIRPNDKLGAVRWSDEQIGRMAAERLIERMHRRGRIGVISSSPTLEATVTRENAFLERIRLEPHMKVLGVQYALSDWARARQAAVDWSSSVGGIQGIFATDEFCTHGAIAAFDKDQQRRPAIVGFAEESDQLDSLEAKHADVMIVTDPTVLADESMGMLLALQKQHLSPHALTMDLFAVDSSWRQDKRVPFLAGLR